MNELKMWYLSINWTKNEIENITGGRSFLILFHIFLMIFFRRSMTQFHLDKTIPFWTVFSTWEVMISSANNMNIIVLCTSSQHSVFLRFLGPHFQWWNGTNIENVRFFDFSNKAKISLGERCGTRSKRKKMIWNHRRHIADIEKYA